MSIEDPQPLRGTLTRVRDGKTETIEMTVEEVKDAPHKYPPHECAQIRVTYEDGEVGRPYRFVDVAPVIKFHVDEKTGRRVCSC